MRRRNEVGVLLRWSMPTEQTDERYQGGCTTHTNHSRANFDGANDRWSGVGVQKRVDGEKVGARVEEMESRQTTGVPLRWSMPTGRTDERCSRAGDQG